MFILENIEINEFFLPICAKISLVDKPELKNNLWSDKIVESTVVNQVCNLFEQKAT